MLCDKKRSKRIGNTRNLNRIQNLINMILEDELFRSFQVLIEISMEYVKKFSEL